MNHWGGQSGQVAKEGKVWHRHGVGGNGKTDKTYGRVFYTVSGSATRTRR